MKHDFVAPPNSVSHDGVLGMSNGSITPLNNVSHVGANSLSGDFYETYQASDYI